MIVKVQRALGEPDGPCLIYDRQRSRITHVVLPPNWVRRHFGERSRIFMEADWPRGRPIQLRRVLKDQDW